MRTRLEHQVAGYAGKGDPERPLGSFAGLMGAYAGFVGLGALVLRRRGIGLRSPGLADGALLALATAKLSRLLARDRVTSPLRAPFTTFEDFATADEVEESPRGHGARLAVGELVTCPWCLGQWVGSGLLMSWLAAPRLTRLVCAGVAVVGAADLVQHGLATAQQKAQESAQEG